MKRALIAVVASLILTGLATAAEDKQKTPKADKPARMTEAQLTDLLAKGRTIHLGGPGAGYTGELVLTADKTGKGEMKSDAGKVTVINGTWRIKGDRFCRTWKGIDDGKEVCEVWQPVEAKKVKVIVKKKDAGVNWWD